MTPLESTAAGHLIKKLLDRVLEYPAHIALMILASLLSPILVWLKSQGLAIWIPDTVPTWLLILLLLPTFVVLHATYKNLKKYTGFELLHYTNKDISMIPKGIKVYLTIHPKFDILDPEDIVCEKCDMLLSKNIVHEHPNNPDGWSCLFCELNITGDEYNKSTEVARNLAIGYFYKTRHRMPGIKDPVTLKDIDPNQ